ncbi:PREDICTED: F-box protein At3g28330-like [Camelina sativa]|uniref:F-box protein At3g28330-like n=1 Tax=Camelina sativa TaxID=90675 RepID=A0ABM0ZBA4_CAMSA|nr:PREDICTED: F-box protein At3g28330-like [Camelina sativa]
MVATSAYSLDPNVGIAGMNSEQNSSIMKVKPNSPAEINGTKRQKTNRKETSIDLPEDLVIIIMARLPPKSVVRFKLVCREWNLLTESAFFRDLYHSNFSSTSSSNWYIFHGDHESPNSSLEELKLDESSSHGDSSFASFLTRNKKKIKEIRVVACTDGLVLLRLEDEEDMMVRYYIGNPVLPQWVQLPPPSPSPYVPNPFRYGFSDTGLVTTRMHNGALLGYKVVRLHSEALKSGFSRTWSFEIYSSTTGEWSVKQVSCPGNGVSMRSISNPVSLNGKLHWPDGSRRIIVHDFFSHDDQVRAVCLPTRMQGTMWDIYETRCYKVFCPSPCGKMICTTSQGYFVLVDVGLIEEVETYNVRVWRLKCDSWNWEKAWEINMACLGLARNCVPMAINYFDIDIIYLWDLDRKCFLACNLRANTKSYGARKDGVYKVFTGFFFGIKEDGVVYDEDTICFEASPCLLQYVPSWQVVPTYIGSRNQG